jgi:hypothetical protein
MEYKYADVTAVVPTCGRYFSSLPLTIMAIINQEVLPSHLIIYDDSPDKLDLRTNKLWAKIFKTIEAKGINWSVLFGEGKGQAVLHNRSIADATTKYIWRVDDDCVPEPNVLIVLLEEIDMGRGATGAVGGLVLPPDSLRRLPAIVNGTMRDVFLDQNIAWYLQEGGPMFVEHLYSTFLYSKEAAAHGYRLDLSPASHREETIFTHQMYLNGWDLVFTPHAITWHYQNPEGGIRLRKEEDFLHDEAVFQKVIKEEWKMKHTDPKVFILDSGIGDHYAFKHALRDYIDTGTTREIIICCCYPDVFHDMKDRVSLYSFADALYLYGTPLVETHNIYKYMAENNWKGPLTDAYKSLYKI